jgi:hypothetical protein
MTICHVILGLMLSAKIVFAREFTPITHPPGSYTTSWIGNSFAGNGATTPNPNGFGYWVQDGVGAMAVSADGTVFLGVNWDEAGRDVGLYKNGTPNRVLVKAPNSPRWAWGFYTANNAVCVDGDYFYVGNLGKALLRFKWTPGDINSAVSLNATVMPEVPVGLSCARGKIAVAYPDKIEVRSETSLELESSVPETGLEAVLLAPDDSFWVIAGGEVRHLDPSGRDEGIAVPGIGRPSSLAWSPSGELIVSDNGPAQQVLFFSVSGTPKLVSTFGEKGGLDSGTPGVVAPQKLFALQGAGMDAHGNLYVAMSFKKDPGGNTFLRAFSPSGNLLWEVYSAAFVDAFGFDPASDGTVVYGRTTRWRLNLDHTEPGTEQQLLAVTLDPIRYPNDLRGTMHASVYPRVVRGTRLLYVTGQTGGKVMIFAGTPGSEILHPVGKSQESGWAWDFGLNGDIWHGDGAGRKIELFPLQSIDANGVPVYDWKHPRTWPWPSDFQLIRRVFYVPATDSLYVFGYLKGQPYDSWGVVGFTGRRYDGWLAGNPRIVWTNTSLPTMPHGLGPNKPLSACAVSLAGKYLFFGAVRTPEKRTRIDILSADDGKFVGTLVGGPEVGSTGGDLDISGAVQALERKDGEYLILVEDDARAKNLLFRWRP